MKKWAVITGAAGGIGSSLVQKFYENNFNVIAIDRIPRPKNLNCERYFELDLESTVCDVNVATTVFKEIEELVALDNLAVLVNNAAVQILGGTNEITREDWQRTVNVNLLAPFFWIQGLSSLLSKSNGSVVNISSIHAKQTKRRFIAYATTKAALSGLTRALAVDVQGKFRINSIELAATETEMLLNGLQSKDKVNSLKKLHPIGRLCSPSEVAAFVLYLAGSESAFINGASLNMDGGISGKLYDVE